MSKNLKIILLAVSLVVLLVSASLLYSKFGDKLGLDNLAQNEEPTENASFAPDFTVYDRSGNAIKLSDLRGKPVVLNFWASWCGPCKMEMPDFNEKYAEYGGDLHFMMVNLTDGYQETESSALSFIDSNGYSFPIYLDRDSEAATAYGVYSIPATYFIDPDGYLIAQSSGMLTAETLQKGIDMIK